MVIIEKISMHVGVAGLGNFFGEKNLTLDMEKHEDLRVVETELWEWFLHYVYVYTFVTTVNGEFVKS